ncbi:MAG: SLBB domain-containing protein [Desulfobacteraceae bacterium]|nr:SLBB domain-containing protein [Desulfobacteraceae bacterium]
MKPAKTLISIAAAILIAAATTGCARNGPEPQSLQRAAYDAEQSKITEEFNKQVFSKADMFYSRAEQVLGPGDLIEVKVFEDEKLNAEVRISSRGWISLPLLGEVEIGGLTASGAETHIEERYEETYIKNPHVSIFVKEHYSQRVTVVGEVENPGTYDSHTRQRLLDAIALAGGLTQDAGRIAQIRKLESAPGDKSPQTYMVDLDKLVNKGQTELNIQINAGDVIFIPKAGSFFVDGAVRRPGKYRIQDVVTINEALLAAGGMAPYADDDELILLRRKESGQREEIRLQLDEKGRVPDKIAVQDGDIILVESSFWGKLFHGAGITLGVPGAGVTFRDPAR